MSPKRLTYFRYEIKPQLNSYRGKAPNPQGKSVHGDSSTIENSNALLRNNLLLLMILFVYLSFYK